MKPYGLTHSTHYVGCSLFNAKSDFCLFILGRRNKISDSNQQMRPPSRVPGIEDRQEKSIIKEKLEQFCFLVAGFVKST